MKILITLFALMLTLCSQANVSTVMVDDLEDTLNAELYDSDGEVATIVCRNSYVGIICEATLEFIDMASFQSVNRATSYKCDETYLYLGFENKKYVTLCSTCWYNEELDIYRQSCNYID